MSIATTIPTPASGTSESIKLEPGTTHQFGFKLSDIVNATPRPDGALELKLSNNSTVVIENFKDLVNSKDICGEDSALLLLDEKAGNEFNMVNLVKSMSSRFEDRVANDNEIVLNAPNAQATKEVMIQPGMKYVVNFDMDQVGKTQDGDNLILSFQNGGIMILRDYAAVASGELPAALTLADGSVIDANSLITGACAVNMPQVAALAAPDIEPAAGDEAGAQSKIAARSIAEKMADIAPAAGTAQKMASAAQDLANIEPAAGGEGAGPSRGYGFTSTRDVVALGGLNPLGPIGPTDLNGEPPSVPPSVGGAVDRVVPTVVPPTPTPPSINVDGVIILEDTVATVPMSIALTNGNAAEILTVVVSGIPAGWTVLNANGTYDAGAGTWTITLPAGQNFNGDLLLKPPADSDIDSPILTVTATSSVAGTASDTFDVRIDAVADAPTLTVPNVGGEEGTAINFPITTAVTDTDGSESIIRVEITGVPVGVTLSAGVLQPGGVWVLTPAELAGLTLNTTNGTTGTYVLTVTSFSREVNTSGLEPNLLNNDANTSKQITLTIGADDVPTLTPATNQLDETGGQIAAVVGTVTGNFGADGPGVFTTNNTFSFNGSSGPTLTSSGVAVIVTQSGNTYTGIAGGQTVFSLTLNSDGSYTFTQNKVLDHADGTDPNDAINLVFGVTATDTDGDPANTTITIRVIDDAPVAVNDSYALSGTTNTATGDVIANDDLSNDVANTISAIRFGANPAQVVAGATVINGAFGVLTINPNGTFSYTANNGATGSDVFTYTLRDGDGDTSTATITFTAADGKPVIGDAARSIDETNGQPITITGALAFDYGTDGKGVTGSIAASNSFTSGGSLLGGNLTSNGVPVTVTLVGNTYTGTAGGVTVFSLTVNGDGTYSFTQNKPLDHADGTNPDDAITLNFGTLITDADGDTDPGTITITVKDDGVDAKCNFVSTDGCHPTVTGNALAEAVFSKDGGNTIVKINFNGTDYSVPASGNLVVSGAFGVLTVAANGAYSYTATNGANGQDKFFYTLKDFDGDTDAACITVTVSDGMPTATDTTLNTDETTINVLHTGTITAGFGTDGPGSMFFTPDPRGFVAGGALFNGQLTSNGVPVTVAIVGGKYIGTAGGQTVFEVTLSQSGAYTFKQFRQLDHGETTNTNEIITLSFCYDIVDCDGEQATANLIIRVADDAPIAHNDVVDCLKQTSVSGNVVLNDTIGTDYDPIILYSVQFKAQVITLTYGGSTTIQGDYGTLFIDSRGNYTYTLKPGETGNRMDTFTYRLCDTDLDKASATLTIKICDDIPVVVDPATLCVDETNLSPMTAISGAISVNYGADGPGIITGTNTFSVAGSIMGASLTSKGAAVAVALVGDTYFGTAGGREVFTLKLNANGTYTFTLKDQLDHGDPNNTNESMTLSFGFKATDVDGDTTNGIVKICVQDDAPTATNDINTVLVCDCALFGNVLVNDRIGADENCFITKVSFNGETYDVAQTTTFTTIVGTYGKLEINQNGNFIYTPTATTGTDVFTYKAVDFDGDSATATLQFNNAPNGTAAPAIAAAEPVAEQPISVLSFDDDLQVAINTFVSATDAGPAPIKAAEITPVAMPIDTHVANDNLDQQHNASTFG